MKGITTDMINQYGLKKEKFDFMGYTFTNLHQLSFHHMIVPKRECKSKGLGDGYIQWNGAILRQDTSHEYLHLIERIDRQKFLLITKYLIEENKLGYLSLDQIKYIRDVLLVFEDQYKNECNKEGKRVLKRKYIIERIDL